MGKPSMLQSVESQRVRHKWATNTVTFHFHGLITIAVSGPQILLPHLLWAYGKEEFCYPVLAVVVVVQLLNHVQLFATPWTAARQASLSFTISQSLLKPMSIESVIHPTISSSIFPFSSHPQSFPASGSQFFPSGDQSIGASASESVPVMNIQDWYPLGLTALISFLWKVLSSVFSSTTVKHINS